MWCTNCQQELPGQARFCPNCGTRVPSAASIQVTQDVGTVAGEVTGVVLGEMPTKLGLSTSTTQTVDTVQSSGAVVGTIVGGGESPIHVGGQQHYGDQVQGDQVGGDKITTGAISGSAVAIGRGAQATVTTGLSTQKVDRLFAPLLQVTQAAPAEVRGQAVQTVEDLQQEVQKGDKADDTRMAKLIDGLTGLVPGAVSAVTSLFATPILAGLAGNATKFVLDKLQGK